MMQAVVTGGTGTAAQIPGIKVAGKTGTAETGENHVNTTWFIAFAPADNPRIAVAVVVERQHATGGEVAAPIAKQIMEALLQVTLSDTLINTLFDGRYRIMRKLGLGRDGRRLPRRGRGARAARRDQDPERQVRARRPVRRALPPRGQERRRASRIPNIVSIYDRGEAEGTYYIAMEYLDGRSLKELVVARGPLPIPRRDRGHAPGARARCGSRTGRASSTATSSRTT